MVFKRVYGWCLFMAMGMMQMHAQTTITNVNRSIKLIKGEAYYVHEVLEGQEIEEIAAAYYTEVAGIVRANPEIRTGLVPGTQLKIPYSDESLEAMSKAASEPPAPKTQTPLQEAVTILEKETPAEEQPAQQETPALSALSQNISESMEALEKARESIEETPVQLPAEEEPQPEPVVAPAKAEPAPLPEPKPFTATPSPPEVPENPRVSFVSIFLDSLYTSFFDTNSADSVFHLREYFFVNLSDRGELSNIKDERTITNKNTHFIRPDTLNGMRIDPAITATTEAQKVAIGLEETVKRYTYSLKVKRRKVRIYRTPLYAEYLPRDHPHSVAIISAAQEMDKKGRCEVVLYEGTKEVSRYSPFEYNPFGTRDQNILHQPVLRIGKFECRK